MSKCRIRVIYWLSMVGISVAGGIVTAGAACPRCFTGVWQLVCCTVQTAPCCSSGHKITNNRGLATTVGIKESQDMKSIVGLIVNPVTEICQRSFQVCSLLSG
jgi:hypothetical protein